MVGDNNKEGQCVVWLDVSKDQDIIQGGRRKVVLEAAMKSKENIYLILLMTNPEFQRSQWKELDVIWGVRV